MAKTLDRRTYAREYARSRRRRAVDAQNAVRITCVARLSRALVCKTPLQSRFVNGETVPFCPTCDRKARGICIKCGTAPVTGSVRRALYCALCKRLTLQESYARYRSAHRKEMSAKEQARLKDPVKRAANLERKRLYRQAVPTKVAAHKKASYLRNREKALAYHAAYRAERREARRERERLRARGELPPRVCLSCPTVVTGRDKKCEPCRRAARAAARAALAARMEAAHG